MAYQIDDYNRYLRVDTAERLEDYIGGFNAGDSNEGFYHVLFLEKASSPSTPAANKGLLYGKVASSKCELHWMDEDGDEIQLSAGGNFGGCNVELVANKDLIGSSTSDITINTNKFTVAGATGNTVIAGTLGVTGVATLADSSQMASSAAPTADADIANKKYVDDTAHTSGIVQLVNVQSGTYSDCDTAMPCDDTIPQNDEGDEVMTLAITPTSATNKLIIEVVVQCGTQGNNNEAAIGLFQDSTANALAAGMGGLSNYQQRTSLTLTHYMAAGTTSETTFKVRLGAAAGGIGFNGITARRFGGVCASSITITEIKV
jgi:hypothetical protein